MRRDDAWIKKLYTANAVQLTLDPDTIQSFSSLWTDFMLAYGQTKTL